MANWIVVASADHVAAGVEGGFMQACHGKKSPLARIRQGDRMIAYSPGQAMGESNLKCFTAAAIAKAGAPYSVDMTDTFTPWRRDMDWLKTRPVSIRPLLEQLTLTRGRRNWGYAFRWGLIAIDDGDADLIMTAMTVLQAPSVRPDLAQGRQPGLFADL